MEFTTMQLLVARAGPFEPQAQALPGEPSRCCPSPRTAASSTGSQTRRVSGTLSSRRCTSRTGSTRSSVSPRQAHARESQGDAHDVDERNSEEVSPRVPAAGSSTGGRTGPLLGTAREPPLRTPPRSGPWSVTSSDWATDTAQRLARSGVGDCVHVDFSCLFDKGLELETPEMVPFRPDAKHRRRTRRRRLRGDVHARVRDHPRRASVAGRLSCPCSRHSCTTRCWSGPRGAKRGGRLAPRRGHIPERAGDQSSRRSGRGWRASWSAWARAVAAAVVPGSPARRLIEEAVSRSNLGRMYVWWMSWN